MTTPTQAMCSIRNCVWYRGSIGPTFDPTHVCVAFPLGIPQDIVDGVNLHETSVEGDEGVTYTPAGMSVSEKESTDDVSDNDPM